MVVVLRLDLFPARPSPDSARSAVEAHMLISRVIDDLTVVHVAHERGSDMHYGAVVEEHSAPPVAAHEAVAVIPEAVRYAAVEPHVRAPIAGVPIVGAVVPTPIAGGPQEPHLRWQHPGSGHPVVGAVVPGPIARRPDVARLRARRLLIHGKRRRRDVHGYTDEDAGRGDGGQRREHECRN